MKANYISLSPTHHHTSSTHTPTSTCTHIALCPLATLSCKHLFITHLSKKCRDCVDSWVSSTCTIHHADVAFANILTLWDLSADKLKYTTGMVIELIWLRGTTALTYLCVYRVPINVHPRAGKHDQIDIDTVSAECESGSVICKHTAEVITWTNHPCSSCVPLNQDGMWSGLRKKGGVMWRETNAAFRSHGISPTYELSPQERAFKCQPPRAITSGTCKDVLDILSSA